MSKKKVKNNDDQPTLIEIVVPQMGEGLQEVKIIRFLKQPGDWIDEDEVIYEMETDKSTIEVESPYSGTLIEWLATAGSTLAVDAVIGRISAEGGTNDSKITTLDTNVEPSVQDTAMLQEVNAPIAIASNNQYRNISPRTRAYCKAQGISLEEMLIIPIANQKLLPSDVDNYLKVKGQETQSLTQTCRDIMLPQQQQLLIQRFKRSQQQIIPATLTSTINMNALNMTARHLTRTNEADKKVLFISEFQILAYVVAQVSSMFPKFRSAFIQDYKIREYKDLNLGIAVQAQTGDLLTAVITAANQLNFLTFMEQFQQQMQLANDGIDQARQAPHILLSYMGHSGIIFGAPVLVEPAVAILFFGTPYKQGNELLANLSLTFDHRLINGMEAAAFLESISKFLIQSETKPTTPSHAEGELNQIKQPDFIGEIQTWLLDTLSDLLGISVSDIDLQESLGLQGMDSIKAVALVKQLELYFQESFPATLLWHYPNYTTLMQYLNERFKLEVPESNNESNVDLDNLVEELKDLSPTELKRLLAKNFLEEG